MSQELAVSRGGALDARGSGFPSHEVRGHRVVLDSDLARLFGVGTKRLNQQLRRNLLRFAGYAFQLDGEKAAALRLQNVTSNAGRGGARYAPWAFTEHGVWSVASVLGLVLALGAVLYLYGRYGSASGWNSGAGAGRGR